MSYQVYLTRGTSWAENEGYEIAAAEWMQIVESDDELHRDEANGPCFAAMEIDDDFGCNWIDWSDGNLFTGYPNRALQRKLLELAADLGAVVQGEDGEIYAAAEDFPEPSAASRHVTGSASRRPLYERRELIWKVLMLISIAAAIVAVNILEIW